MRDEEEEEEEWGRTVGDERKMLGRLVGGSRRG